MVVDAVGARRIDEQLPDQAGAIAVHSHRAVEAFVDYHPGSGVAGAADIAWDLEQMWTEADGVVTAHDAAVLEAEQVVEVTVFRLRHPGCVRVGSEDGEVAVVAWQVVAEHLLGMVGGRGPSQAQLAGETILRVPQVRSMRPA